MKLTPKHFGQEFVIKNGKEYRVPWIKGVDGEIYASVIDVDADLRLTDGFWRIKNVSLLTNLVETYLTKENK